MRLLPAFIISTVLLLSACTTGTQPSTSIDDHGCNRDKGLIYNEEIDGCGPIEGLTPEQVEAVQMALAVQSYAPLKIAEVSKESCDECYSVKLVDPNGGVERNLKLQHKRIVQAFDYDTTTKNDREQEEAIRLLIKNSNYCTQDSDCIDAGSRCPFGCNIYVNKERRIIIQQTLKNYQSNCEYTCTAPLGAVCQEGVCIEKGEQATMEEY